MKVLNLLVSFVTLITGFVFFMLYLGDKDINNALIAIFMYLVHISTTTTAEKYKF